jgi:hypothetical protein
MIAFVTGKKILKMFFLVRKISEKIFRGNSFFRFTGFQNNSKNFWRLTETPEKILCVREKSGNFFPARSVHALPRKQELFPTTKKPDKPS